MSHDINAAASILGIRPHRLRRALRDLGVIAADGSLAAAHRGAGNFEVSTRAWWNPSIQKNVHYAVVLVTEDGIAWVARKLGIPVASSPRRPDPAQPAAAPVSSTTRR